MHCLELVIPPANTSAEVFSVPTKEYITHELTVMVPWFIKRYVLFQKVPKPPAIIAKAANSAPGSP